MKNEEYKNKDLVEIMNILNKYHAEKDIVYSFAKHYENLYPHLDKLEMYPNLLIDLNNICAYFV